MKKTTNEAGEDTTEVVRYAPGEYSSKAAEDFRTQRWKDVTKYLRSIDRLFKLLFTLGFQHSKRCTCDPLTPSAGVYTALVDAEGKICQDLLKK